MGTASLARPDHNSDFFYIIIKFHRVGYLSSLNTSYARVKFRAPIGEIWEIYAGGREDVPRRLFGKR